MVVSYFFTLVGTANVVGVDFSVLQSEWHLGRFSSVLFLYQGITSEEGTHNSFVVPF